MGWCNPRLLGKRLGVDVEWRENPMSLRRICVFGYIYIYIIIICVYM